MKKVYIFLLAVLILMPLYTCAETKGDGSGTSSAAIEMELTKDYDTKSPFIDERIFYVTSNDVDDFDLDIFFQMKGKRGLLEIAENETKKVLWNETWDGNVDAFSFIITFDRLIKDREYVIRFTGTEIEYAKVILMSKNNAIKEGDRPLN